MDWLAGGSWTDQLAQPVVNCILSATSEFIKSDLGSAQVLLGLTPSILAVMGASTEETALLFAIGRRPLLSLCLAAGSPAVFPMRSFENRKTIALLKARKGRLRPPPLNYTRATVVMAVEYLIVICAVANVATLSRDLGVRVVCSFAPHLTYLVLLWAFLIVVVHGFGFVSLLIRARISCEKVPNTIIGRFKIQFTPYEKQGRLDLTIGPETYPATLFAWFTALLTVCHTIFGTLVFSSMLFISVRDSIAVIGRYMASVMCSRVVLMYELAILRDAIAVGHINDIEEDEISPIDDVKPDREIHDTKSSREIHHTWGSGSI